MAPDGTLALFLGAVGLGAVHGIEPGHGWPVAATYALNRSNEWLHGLVAGLVIGVGHLISSLAVVAVFFYAKGYFDLTQVNEPIVVWGVQFGGPVSLVAGVLLVLLGVREYGGHGHSHGTGDDEAHDHAHDDEAHDHAHDDGGLRARLASFLPFGGHSHSHGHDGWEEQADRGLLGIAWFAFVLGFAHEEEFEIIAFCAGSNHCLGLMMAYALTVIAGIVGLTLLLLSSYQRYEDEVERFTPYLPTLSAVILVVMGLGFVTGLF